MKPSWNDAPEWAQYLAMDSDGTWYWYDSRPRYNTESFGVTAPGKAEFAACTDIPKWQESLESRPEPEASV